MKVRCVRLVNENRQRVARSSWLTVGNIYRVLEISVDNRGPKFRLMSDNNSLPALFYAEQFELVSNLVPKCWVVDFGENRSIRFFRLAPRPWTRPGFWEAFLDGDKEAKTLFEDVCRELELEEP